MYNPERYRIADQTVMDEFMRRYDFATMITSDADGIPVVSHIPLVLKIQKDSGVRLLQGHLARANMHWKLLEHGLTTLAVFHGPHSYISPRWYTNPDNVPTWNYQVVHATCCPRIFTDKAEILRNTTALTELYEPDTGYSIGGLSPKMLDTDLRGIVGFELLVERCEAKFKLSQNRDAESYANIITQLQASNNPLELGVAEAMQRFSPFRTSPADDAR